MSILASVASAWSWADAHPFFVTLAFGVAFGAFNWIAKPRTALEYAVMSPRRAAFHRFMAATFPDTQKAFESLKNLIYATRPAGAPTVVMFGQAQLEAASEVLSPAVTTVRAVQSPDDIPISVDLPKDGQS